MNRPLSTLSPNVGSRSRGRGFTLVELMVAMAAGLVVAAAAMLLAKNASQFFQYEARISAAQLGLTLGMNRITQDLQRAALLSSPNIQRDSTSGLLCGDVTTYPVGLQQLAGIHIIQGGSAVNTPQSVANDLNPDILIVGGSLSTTEQFAVRSTSLAAGGSVVLRLEDDDAMKRVRVRARAAAGAGEDIAKLFRIGRFLRIIDQDFKHEYGVISQLSQGPSTDPYVDVTLAANPAVPTNPPGLCGLHGHETGALVSVVYRVQYELRGMLGDQNYGVLVAPVTPSLTGDNGRTELVRTELDEQDVPLLPNNTQAPPELVVEYAVDLKFGLESAVWDPVTSTFAANRYPIRIPEDASVYSIAASVAGGGTPETVRAVQVRFSTRARAPDRAVDLDIDQGLAPDGRLSRFFLNDVIAPPTFARTRTLYTDVSLPNQAGVQ